MVCLVQKHGMFGSVFSIYLISFLIFTFQRDSPEMNDQGFPSLRIGMYWQGLAGTVSEKMHMFPFSKEFIMFIWAVHLFFECTIRP